MRFLAPCLLVLAGCAGPLSRGESQFRDGQYPAAKQTFAQAEQESRGWPDDQRAAYALYRGLTLAALGDRAGGATWLREARAIQDAHPGSLPVDDVQRLKVALEANDVVTSP